MTSTAPERAPRKDAAENREAILRAAALLLNDDPDASLEAIAAAAGLSRRALYGHFATRDDLLRELVVLGALGTCGLGWREAAAVLSDLDASALEAGADPSGAGA
jgi:AcrR family transcriptional regulator